MSTISSAGLFYNPLALSTATNTWNNSSGFSAIPKAIGSAIYDVYAKNPYDLTIGNAQKVIEGGATPSVAKVALALVGICFSASICGAGIYALGAQAHTLGTSLGSPLLAKVASKVSLYGEKLFLTGAVPLYAVGYEFPKYLIENAPRALNYLANQVEKAANWTFCNVIKPIWDIAYPILRAAYKHVAWAVDKVITVIDKTFTLIVKTAKYIFENFIIPAFNKIGDALVFTAKKIAAILKEPVRRIAEAVKYVFNNLIIPTFKIARRAITWAVHKITAVLSAIARNISRAANYVLKTIIAPAFNAVCRAFTWVANKIGSALNTVLSAISKVANYVFKEFVSPAFNAIYRGCSFLLQKTTAVASWLFANVISPVLDGVYFAGKALTDYVISPLYKKSVEITTYALTAIGNTLIPVVALAGRTLQQVANHTYQLIEKVQSTLSGLFTSTSFALKKGG